MVIRKKPHYQEHRPIDAHRPDVFKSFSSGSSVNYCTITNSQNMPVCSQCQTSDTPCWRYVS